MNVTKDQWVLIARSILIAALAIASILGYDIAIVQPREAAITARADQLTRGVTHHTEISADTLRAAAPTSVGTATPALMVDSDGISVILEARDAATPVFSIDDGGVVDVKVGPFTLEGDESILNPDGGFDFTRDDAGAVTLFCSDDDATCAMVLDAGGAASITIGSADVTAFTVTTDGTGDAEAALPENSIGPDEGAFMTDLIYFCGQQVVTGTVYLGPVTAFLTGDFTAAYVMGDAQCNALEDSTEATADAPIGYANTTFKVLGMMCEVSSSGSNGITATMRSAEADLTPTMTCTIATGETSCTSVTSSTTDIAADATLAIKIENTEDLSAQDAWCKVLIAYK